MSQDAAIQASALIGPDDLDAILGHVGDAIWLIDSGARLIFGNAAACRLLGCDLDAIAGMQLDAVFTDAAGAQVSLQPESHTGHAAGNLRWMLVPESGPRRPIEVTIGRLAGGRHLIIGRVPGAAAALPGSNEAAARADGEWLARLERTAATVPGVIYSFRLRPDGSSCFPYVSPTIESRYGIDPHEVTADASQVLAMVHPDDLGRVRASIAESARTLTAWQAEFRVRHPGKGEIWIEGNSIPQREADGAILWHGYLAETTQRKRVEDALAKSEAKLSSIFRAAPIGIGLVTDRVFQEVNPALCLMLGYSRDELIGENARMVYPSQEEFEFVGREKYRRIRAEDGGEVETRWRRKDGGIIDVRLRSVALDPTDLSKGVTFTALEITGRKRAEERVSKLNRLYRMLSGSNQTMMRCREPAILFREICDIAVRDGGFRMAWIGLIEGGRVVPVVHAGEAGDYLQRIDIASDGPRSKGPTGIAWRERRYALCNDIAHDPAMQPWREAALAQGYRASAAFPLVVAGELRGIFNMYAGEPDFFDREEVEVLVELASDLAFGLEVAQAEEERQMALAALKESEAKYRLLAENASDWIFWVAPDERFLYSSPSCRQVSGYAPAEFVADPGLMPRIIHPDDLPRYREHRLHLLATDQHDLEFRILHRDGSVRWIAHRCWPLFDEAGKFVGSRGGNRDITERMRVALELDRHREHLEELVSERTAALQAEILERRRAEEVVEQLNSRLREHAAELEQSNRDLESFSYTVSHDLRAPLRAINGFAHILREEEGGRMSPDGLHLLERVMANSTRMGQLIEDVLHYSRAGRVPMQRGVVDMQSLVREVVEELGAIYPDTEVVLGALPSCMADATMMRQVFSNLIGNALKFSAQGAAPRVEIGSRSDGGVAEYFVTDNGVGFDMNLADKLFGMFQRLHAAADFSGSGVGLAIVKRLVERHGGRVWAESAIGCGATFRFTLGTSIQPAGV